MSPSHRSLLLVALLTLTAACNRSGPEPSPAAAKPQASAPAVDCRHDISAEDCAQATASLQQDAAALAAQAASIPAPTELQSDDARAAALMASECLLHRRGLAALQRMQRGEGEMLTDEELAQLPAEIERVQAYLSSNCK